MLADAAPSQALVSVLALLNAGRAQVPDVRLRPR